MVWPRSVPVMSWATMYRRRPPAGRGGCQAGRWRRAAGPRSRHRLRCHAQRGQASGAGPGRAETSFARGSSRGRGLFGDGPAGPGQRLLSSFNFLLPGEEPGRHTLPPAQPGREFARYVEGCLRFGCPRVQDGRYMEGAEQMTFAHRANNVRSIEAHSGHDGRNARSQWHARAFQDPGLDRTGCSGGIDTSLLRKTSRTGFYLQPCGQRRPEVPMGLVQVVRTCGTTRRHHVGNDRAAMNRCRESRGRRRHHLPTAVPVVVEHDNATSPTKDRGLSPPIGEGLSRPERRSHQLPGAERLPLAKPPTNLV